MTNIIQKAETYCRTLKGKSTAHKKSMLYAKFGAILGAKTCGSISEKF